MSTCYKCTHTCTADDPCPCCRVAGYGGYHTVTGTEPVLAKAFGFCNNCHQSVDLLNHSCMVVAVSDPED